MDYSQIRATARQRLAGRWALAIAVAALAWLLGGLMVGSSFLPQFTYYIRGEDITLKDALSKAFTIGRHFGNTFLSSNLLTLARFLIGGVIQLGYADILLKQHTGEEYTVSHLFSQFHRFGQGFAQAFLRELYTALWTLLLIIPGIVAHYKYAMTPYIMADHPELTAGEAIDLSKELMDGHKGELFILHLTFIGWDLLAALTLNVGHLVLNPYKCAAEAAFYRKLTAAVNENSTLF